MDKLYLDILISTQSLSHLRTMLPEIGSQPLPAKRPNHATQSLYDSKSLYMKRIVILFLIKNGERNPLTHLHIVHHQAKIAQWQHPRLSLQRSWDRFPLRVAFFFQIEGKVCSKFKSWKMQSLLKTQIYDRKSRNTKEDYTVKYRSYIGVSRIIRNKIHDLNT